MSTGKNDLQWTAGLDTKGVEDGFKRVREEAVRSNAALTNNMTQQAKGFSNAWKSNLTSASYAAQDFFAVLGQGGSNVWGRALMSMSNNIGVLNLGLGAWGPLVTGGAAILGSTLIPALLASADASRKATEGIERFLEQSNNIGKNVDLRRGFGRQLEDVLRGGGGGLPGLVRSLGHDREDIQAEMDKLEGQFNTSGKILESFHQGRERIKREAERIRWGEGRPTAGSMAAADKFLRQEMEKLETLQNTIFRLQPEELQKRFPGQDIAPLLELQKQWGGLADKLREVEAAENKAKDAMRKPFPPEATGAHLRDSMDAARSEIAFLNKSKNAGIGPLAGLFERGPGGEMRVVGLGREGTPGRRPELPASRGPWGNIFRPDWADVDNAVPHRADRRGRGNANFERDWEQAQEFARERNKDVSKLSGLAEQQLEEQRKTNQMLRTQKPVQIKQLDAGP